MARKAIFSGTIVRSGVEEGVKFLTSHGVAGPLIEQFSNAFERYPGGTLARNWIREWANHLDPLKRSFIEPVIERLMYEHSTAEKEGDDMAGGRDRRPNRGGGKDRPAVSLDLVAKARGNIALLSPDQRSLMHRLVETISSDLHRSLVLTKLGGFSLAMLRNTAEHFMALDGKVDLVAYFGVLAIAAGESGGSSIGVEDGIKAAMLLGKLPETILTEILDVTMDIANDSPEDQLNFNRKLANLWGDGKEETINRAITILTIVASKPIEKRRTWFNVRPNPKTQIKAAFKKAFGGLRPSRVSDAAVIAAEQKASHVWVRIRTRRLQEGQRLPHGGIIVVSH